MAATTTAVCVAATAVGLWLVRKLRERQWGYCRSRRTLEGRVCIVTGANGGIGFEVAKDLARRKARVILACRNLNNARKAVEDIRREGILTGELIPMQLDLSSLESIREFSKEALEQFQEIHLLVNNAGVYVPVAEKQKTADGFELHFGVNHLGHFLLTNLLIERIVKSKPSRIVTVSSTLHEKGEIDFDNLQLEDLSNLDPKKSRTNPGYCNSKLANALFSQELAQRVPEGVSSYAVCPGFTLTNLFRSFNPKFYHYIMFAPIMYWYMRSATQGAQGVIACAVSEDFEGQSGLFYKDCKLYKSKADLNPEIAKKLWEKSQELVSLK
ncbi:retinol dehydrogenase 12-like [Cloeon dipterum]|uniref:retinol dehydrogenase 12-like n=1 Tax=Cloeon dipterum TaxID=197152 RepID=UPI00321FBF62